MTAKAEIQLDMFGPVPMVSRWVGDGPFASEIWRDEGDGRAIRRFFDGSGWCQMMCAPCPDCGVHHPLDLEWGGGGYRALAYRCATGRDGWFAVPLRKVAP